MKILELIERPALLVSMKCLLYSCRYHTLPFKMLWITEPLNKLTKLGDIWEDIVVWSCFKEPAERFKNKLLI